MRTSFALVKDNWYIKKEYSVKAFERDDKKLLLSRVRNKEVKEDAEAE